jgi:hypothetical protein
LGRCGSLVLTLTTNDFEDGMDKRNEVDNGVFKVSVREFENFACTWKDEGRSDSKVRGT